MDTNDIKKAPSAPTQNSSNLPEGFQLENDLPQGFHLEGAPGIPASSEGFLQSAIKNYRGAVKDYRMGPVPMGAAGFMPTTMDEARDIGSAALKYGIGIDKSPNPFMEIGVNLADPTYSYKKELGQDQLSKKLEPKTDFGEVIHMGAAMAPYVAMGLEGATVGFNKLLSTGALSEDARLLEGQMGEAGAESERLQNIKNYLQKRGSRETGYVDTAQQKAKNTYNQQVKQVKGQAREDAASFAYSSKEGMSSKVQSQFDTAKTKYGVMLEGLDPSTMSTQDHVNILDKVIDEKGILNKLPEYWDSTEKNLVGLRNQLSGAIESRSVPIQQNILGIESSAQSGSTPIDDPVMLKNFKNKVFNVVKQRPDIEASFYNHFGDALKNKGLSAFTEASNRYTDAYKALEATKGISEADLKNVALGNKGQVPENQLQKFIQAEKRTGTNYTSQGQEIAAKTNKRLGDLEKQYTSTQQELSNKQSGVKQKYGFSDRDLGQRIEDLNTYLDDLGSIHEGTENQLQKIIGRQKVAKKVGLGALGLGGLGAVEEIIRHLWRE